MDKILSYEILCKIFVECQRPEIAFLSRPFYQVSTSPSVQADFLIKEFGKAKVYTKYGVLNAYPKLAGKETLLLSLLNRNIHLHTDISPIFNTALKNGWKTVIAATLKIHKLQKVPLEHLDSSQNENSSFCYTLKPVININNISLFCLLSCPPEKLIDILNILNNAHKIRINISNEYGITDQQPLHDNKFTALHKKFNISSLKTSKSNENTILINHFANLNSFNITLDYKPRQLQAYYESAIFIKNQNIIDNLLAHHGPSVLYTQNSFTAALNVFDIPIAKAHLSFGIPLPKNTHLFLEKASELDNLEMVKFLVESCKVSVLLNDQRAARAALKNNNAQFLDYYSNNGTDVALLHKLVDWAVLENNVDAINMLSFKYGETNSYLDLEYAFWNISRHSLEKFTCLLESNVNSETDWKRILLECVNSNLPSFVKLLLKKLPILHDNIQPFFEKACIDGWYEMTKTILEGVDQKDIDMSKLLVEIYCLGHFDIVTLLINNGANFRINDEYLLFATIKNQNLNLVNLIAEKDGFTNFSHKKSFYYSCKHGYNRIVQQMILFQPNKNCYSIDSCLIVACKHGHIEICKLLLEYGANPKAENNSTISNACESGNLELVKFLVDCGVDITSNSEKYLSASCKSGNFEMVKFVANYCDKLPKDSKNLVISSFLTCNHEIYEFLLSSGAEQITVINCGFISACKSGSYKIVDQLLNNFCIDVRFKNNLGLIWACENNHLSIAKLLITKGAEINARKGRALISACRKGYYDIVKLLIKHNVNPMAKNNRPLICACQNDHIDIVKLLINSGINLYHKKGQAIYWITKVGSPRTKRLILRRNIPIDYLTKSLTWAIKGKNRYSLTELELNGVDLNSAYGFT
ncbi:hypothetical protein BB559_003368 [Furculomyces boomerangus]|uniref:Ankyrin repeat protein n=2 Tax=Harpellales TaxID=61421 RepID=A0A2T9YLQ1_9FUNG|nr:hypothetical protein BB559_003368 [Furculomyces boomerangus]PWA00423.1 hypothetical protein BB558_003523 [Smittium angustum]